MKKVKTSKRRRMCKFPHCNQVLSIYNHETYCHVHLSLAGRGKKQKAAKT